MSYLAQLLSFHEAPSVWNNDAASSVAPSFATDLTLSHGDHDVVVTGTHESTITTADGDCDYDYVDVELATPLGLFDIHSVIPGSSAHLKHQVAVEEDDDLSHGPRTPPVAPAYSDNTIITISVPAADLEDHLTAEINHQFSRPDLVCYGSPVEHTPPRKMREISMTSGEYLRFWARDSEGRYVGTEPEGEGRKRLQHKQRRRMANTPRRPISPIECVDACAKGVFAEEVLLARLRRTTCLGCPVYNPSFVKAAPRTGSSAQHIPEQYGIERWQSPISTKD